ncbi:MAG: monovalent cation/H(+) antiporter subunit G [Ketobacteraceae bacterium]|nr:monovalent cation/H(+) antiporter subunit G [Ketobacteraceae bacterium]
MTLPELTPLEWLHYALLWLGALVCMVGSLGVYRFPNTLSRLHALTKVDNAGLGLIVLGLVLDQPNWVEALKLVLVWLLVLAGSATCSHLLAQFYHRQHGAPADQLPPPGQDPS